MFCVFDLEPNPSPLAGFGGRGRWWSSGGYFLLYVVFCCQTGDGVASLCCYVRFLFPIPCPSTAASYVLCCSLPSVSPFPNVKSCNMQIEISNAARNSKSLNESV